MIEPDKYTEAAIKEMTVEKLRAKVKKDMAWIKDLDKREETASEDHLAKTLKAAYLFASCENEGMQGTTGCQEMMDMLCDALCNHIGDEAFQKWMEE